MCRTYVCSQHKLHDHVLHRRMAHGLQFAKFAKLLTIKVFYYTMHNVHYAHG